MEGRKAHLPSFRRNRLLCGVDGCGLVRIVGRRVRHIACAA